MLARIRKATEEKDQGFTLIELLVVMIIIGILAAIAIPVFLNQRKKAVESAMKSDLRTVANELETYFVDNQAYPLPANFVPSSATAATVTLTTGGSAIAVSKGNVLTNEAGTATTVAPGTFCLKVTNTQVGSDFFVYDSDKGGLRAKNADCA